MSHIEHPRWQQTWIRYAESEGRCALLHRGRDSAAYFVCYGPAQDAGWDGHCGLLHHFHTLHSRDDAERIFEEICEALRNNLL